MEELKSNSVSGRDYNPVYASASSGDVEAQIKLGKMYRDGDGVEKDGKKAVEWLTKAAEQGSLNAHYFLGDIYASGNGVPLSYSKALEWFKFPLDQGDSDTQVYVGWLHEKGFGVPQDYSKAAEYYALAAEKGNSTSQYNLGNFYRGGLGVPKDENKALEYYSLAAQQGDSDSQAQLGRMYIARNDYEKGKDYLRMAGENGNQSALETLKKIEADQEKKRTEDSIKKVTCPYCETESVWGKKYCRGCTARIRYEPIRLYEWIGLGLAVAFVGYAITQGYSFVETSVIFMFIWVLGIVFGKLFGKKTAYFFRS
ncbi:sel1 repeat family protein [Yokenella regensburgei]|uniref:tetratricopeptide repeat protein n=1 Tax=Yokenella regensburgei TaxID=158877 RepID=UPI003F16BEE4